jgi:O-acetyl-ADP-ribose deacetylase (regulator of RNase III)
MLPKIIKGDLLNFNCDMIVQQCNCVTIKSHGLAQAIKDKYPYGDIYSKRAKKSTNQTKKPDIPGTSVICNSPTNPTLTPHIACLLAQFYPGKPGNYYKKYYNYPNVNYDDSKKNREKWFADSLVDLENKLKNDYTHIKEVAFPYNIGCGLAGGNWDNYLKMIKEFSIRNDNICVYIIKLP